ncbi:MAG: hypothetical protein SNJ78_02325 [Spirochaetales bacterium]
MASINSPKASEMACYVRSLTLATCLLLLSPLLGARDFPEPLPVFDALWEVPFEEAVLLPASYVELRYDNYTFRSSVTDDFQIHALGSFTLLQYPGKAALKLSYASFLLVGPLAPGDVAASAAKWWMNSIQFQYGVYGAWNLWGFHLLAEYSRLSNHPLRSKRTETESFENPASERIATGIVLPSFTVKGLQNSLYYRTGYVDLFDYWKAKNIPKPRNFWLHRLGWEVLYPITPLFGGFAEVVVDVLALRGGGWDAVWNSRIGVALQSGSRTLKGYLTVVWNNDTEEIVEKPNPIRLVGLGFSLSSGP